MPHVPEVCEVLLGHQFHHRLCARGEHADDALRDQLVQDVEDEAQVAKRLQLRRLDALGARAQCIQDPLSCRNVLW